MKLKKEVLWAFIAILLLLPIPIYAGTNVWTSIGPANTGCNAYITGITFNHHTPTILYVSVFGCDGVYKTTNGGNTWSVINNGLTDKHVLTLVVDPMTPSTLYVGTCNGGDCKGGIFKSVDGGESWMPINNGLTADWSIWVLAIDPTNPSILYAGTGGAGVFKSTDGGETWRAINNGLSSSDWIYTLAIDPQNPSVIYAGGFNCGGVGVVKSTDGGEHWFPANQGIPEAFSRSIAVDPQSPLTIYSVTQTYGIYKSIDGGNSWYQINNGIASLTNLGNIVIDTDFTSTLYVAGQVPVRSVYKSTDGGQNWIALNKGLPKKEWQSPAPVLAINSLITTTVYAGTTLSLGGVYSITFSETTCSAWTDVIEKYQAYKNGQATLRDVIDCYREWRDNRIED
jgi:photosystem II stability/assembly factor-like uncharacterized protein